MLLSAVILLRAQETTVLPSYLGKAAHALFLSLISSADAEVGARLHEDSVLRPFTVSDLMGLPHTRGGVRTTAGQTCFLRFTSYANDLSNLLAQKVLPSLPAEVELANGRFAVEEVFLESTAHALSGRVSYEELVERHLLQKKRSPVKVRLYFASPTTFRSGGKNVPLPLPGLVFGSLVDRWNAISPITISAEVRQYAEECLAISQCRLRTHTVDVAGGKQVGFTGSCSYVAVRSDSYWLRVVDLLAAFAFYSGVGYKTTMGFGQTYLRSFPTERAHHADTSHTWRHD